MKAYFIIPLFFLTACASHPRSHIVKMPPPVPGTIMPPETVGTVRYPENIKAYPIGRYIDPNDGLVMHEQHTIYRIETTTRWNLHPSGEPVVAMGPPVGIIDTAHRDPPLNAEIVAEVNKQKAASQALLGQKDQLNQSFSQIGATLQLMQGRIFRLGEDNAALQKRMDELAADLRTKQSGAFAGTDTKTNEW